MDYIYIYIYRKSEKKDKSYSDVEKKVCVYFSLDILTIFSNSEC